MESSIFNFFNASLIKKNGHSNLKISTDKILGETIRLQMSTAHTSVNNFQLLNC